MGCIQSSTQSSNRSSNRCKRSTPNPDKAFPPVKDNVKYDLDRTRKTGDKYDYTARVDRACERSYQQALAKARAKNKKYVPPSKEEVQRKLEADRARIDGLAKPAKKPNEWYISEAAY